MLRRNSKIALVDDTSVVSSTCQRVAKKRVDILDNRAAEGDGLRPAGIITVVRA